MLLVQSAYIQPFRSFLINPDGSVLAGYRPTEDKIGMAGLYQAPWDDLVDALLKDDIHPNQITDMVVLGKPMVFLEKFLAHSLIPPTPAKIFKFAIGIEVYITQFIRIINQVEEAFRNRPTMNYVSVLDAELNLAKIVPNNGDILFWNILNENGMTAVYSHEEKKLTTLSSLEKGAKKYRKSKNTDSRHKFLDDAIAELKNEQSCHVLFGEFDSRPEYTNDTDMTSILTLMACGDYLLVENDQDKGEALFKNLRSDAMNMFGASLLNTNQLENNNSKQETIWGTDDRLKYL